MVQDFAEDACRLQTPVIKVRQIIQCRDRSRSRVEAVVLLELLRELIGQKRTGLGHEALQP